MRHPAVQRPISVRALASSIEPFTVHGGRLDQARAAFPAVSAWTDLSTGIAPWPYPFRLEASQLAPLPDPAALADLEAVAARTFGTTAARVAAVPGTDLALRLLGVILLGKGGWLAPGYSGHRAMWPAGRGTQLDRTDLLSAAQSQSTIVLARPNNPDGWIADSDLLEKVASRLAYRGGHLIVDEAFVDAAPEESLSGCAWPGLIVLRSFGKFFGLAGSRLGFVIAEPDVLDRLRGLLGDWPISGPALTAGRQAYADETWQSEQRKRLHAGSHRMASLLAEHGLSVHAYTAFFTLIECPQRDALFAHLIEAGVLTRPFSAEPHWLRLGLPGDEAGWTMLTQALTSWRAG